jgi:AAA15 family ATPase/GTPase
MTNPASFFNTVHISNFKSLKDVTLSDCKRINLLIGKPNVGKSNILEAIGLFSLPYFKFNKSKKINQFVRLENIAELFFDGNIYEAIKVIIDNNKSCTVNYLEREGLFRCNLHSNKDGKYNIDIDSEFNLNLASKREKFYPLPARVSYYKFPHTFEKLVDPPNLFNLTPPCGSNLSVIIQLNRTLTDELSTIFSEYGLQLVFDNSSRTLKIMKSIKNKKEVFILPYSSISDTLQRLIFFKTAIVLNNNSILLFEEPEAHCFPPYIAHFTQDVINSTSNQFFIATHSPYVLNDFLETEETRKELAIFIADFKDGQTVINRLTDDEVNEVYDYGIDVFFNYERFTRHDG